MAIINFSPITLGAELERTQNRVLVLTETEHKANLHLEPHRHVAANFVFVLDGSFVENIEGDKYNCKRGSILLKPAAAVHSDLYGSQGARCLILEMNPQFLKMVDNTPNSISVVKYMDNADGRDFTRRVYREFRINDSASILAIESLILELFSRIVRSDIERSVQNKWMSQARWIIQGRYREKLSLKTISDEVGIHPAHLARTFRERYGMTVGSYIRRLRLEHAISDLTVGDKSLVEIAIDSGFYDQSHFHHAFQRFTGHTPAQFQRNAKTAK